MPFGNAYFIIGNAYAGKSTLARLLAEKHGGILCGENWHDSYPEPLDAEAFPGLCYTRDLKGIWGRGLSQEDPVGISLSRDAFPLLGR